MGIPHDYRRGRRDKGVELQIVAGTWADPRGSYYEVTCDSGFDGESYSCSVRIQRPNGDVFDRQSVIQQFGDWTIVWGQKYVLDEATSNEHKLQWNNLRGGSGFVWQRVTPEHSRKSYGYARRGTAAHSAPPRAQEYHGNNWNSWFGWRKREHSAWQTWEKVEHDDSQAATVSDFSHDSGTETHAKKDLDGLDGSFDGRRDGPCEQSILENETWRPSLHPTPPRSKHNKQQFGRNGYFNREVVASRLPLDFPFDAWRKDSHRQGQYNSGCVSYASAADFKDVPIYAGYLERFDKEKNSGTISSPGALADFKQNVYVHGSVLHSSRVCLNDYLCFAIHTNAHGKPQASRPLLRLQARKGYALSGTYTAAGEDSANYAGTIHCRAVLQLFDWDVQVSHEATLRGGGRGSASIESLHNGDEVNFNARWIYEDDCGRLEAYEVYRQHPQSPPGLPGVPTAEQATEPTEDNSFGVQPERKDALNQKDEMLRDGLELLGGLRHDLDMDESSVMQWLTTGADGEEEVLPPDTVIHL